MNVVALVGRLTKDGEFHDTQSGGLYRMQIAVDREFKQEGGQTADYIRVVVFGKSAENCNKYLSKGKLVGVKGRIQTGKYEGKDGQTVYTTDVIAERVEFLSPRDKEFEPMQTVETNYAALDQNVPF